MEQERAFLESWDSDEQRSLLLVAVRKDENGNERIIADATLSAKSKRFAHRAVLGISVVKSEWGRGIATELISRLIEHGRSHGVEIIELEVMSHNERAIRLYERFGFKRIGVFPAFSRIDGRDLDAILMYLDLRK